MLGWIPVDRVVVRDVDRWGGGDHGEPSGSVLGGGVQAGPALQRAARGDRKTNLRDRGCGE